MILKYTTDEGTFAIPIAHEVNKCDDLVDQIGYKIMPLEYQVVNAIGFKSLFLLN